MPRKQSTLWGLLTVTIIGFVSFISACAAFEDPSEKATQNAQSTQLWTLVHGIETQASTVEALRQTADSAVVVQTQWANATLQVGALRATNQALLRNPAPTANINLPPTVPGGGSAPVGSAPSPVPGSQYMQGTTSTEQDENGCAVGIQNTFTQEVQEVYFITRILDLTPGITFGLRIRNAGQVVMTDPNFWVSDDAYDDICVWYLIDRETIAFEAGTYTVELLVNNVARARTTFVVTGDATPDADTMSDG